MPISIPFSANFRLFAQVVFGTAVYAFALHFFVIPNELMEGGVTGIAILLNYAFGAKPSLTTLLLNIPLFVLGWKILGKSFMAYTVLGTLSLSFCLWVMEGLIRAGWVVPFVSDDHLLVVLYAGVTMGGGLGIVFRSGATTGGTDIIARLGSKLWGLTMGKMFLVIETLVIGSSIFYIPKEKVMYTLVMLFIVTRVIDFVQEGAFAARAYMIVTEMPERITRAIDEELARGATWFKARGSFTKRDREVVYCVVYKNETQRMQAIIRRTDPDAFVVVSDVRDVFGEGFRLPYEAKE
jgi:Uncharacterized conserved protein